MVLETPTSTSDESSSSSPSGSMNSANNFPPLTSQLSRNSNSPVTNAMLVSSPYKLVSPPPESDWNPWRAEHQKAQLNQALWDAVHDPDLHDVALVANDGEQIPASRFVLAARSPVLKRMLYGSFREAKSSTICMMGYESAVLKSVVYYCQTNQMPVFEKAETTPRKNNDDSKEAKRHNTHSTGDLEAMIRQHVRLYQAADFLELNELGNLVHFEIRRLTGLYPGLACAVFDEVDDVNSRVGEFARLMMEVRPYVSLGAGTRLIANPTVTPPDSFSGTTASPNKVDTDEDCNESMGGVECLRSERLQLILESDNLMCGELFLFQMLRQWYDNKITYLGDNVDDSTEYEKEASALLEVSLECAKSLHMENIEPAALLQIVQPCPFIHPSFLYGAFAKQALRASQHRVWSLHSRPTKYQTVERVLVEDCGSRQVRGMYVRMVSGLKKTHAALYTKREVVSGQPMVYTLSCSVVNPAMQQPQQHQQHLLQHHVHSDGTDSNHEGQEMVECRIFCSPLLTPHAIPTLFQFHSNSAYVDPLFQPILQVVAVKPSSHNNKRPRTVVVSDGHYCMQASLANNMAIHNSKEIQLYGVLQVLAFRLNQSNPVGTSSSCSLNSNHNSNRHASNQNGLSGIPRLHIQRVSIVNSNAGQVFGRPTFFRGPPKQELSPQKDIHSIAEENDEGLQHVSDLLDDEASHPHSTAMDTIGDDASTFAPGHHHAVVKDLKHVTVLYSCSYPLKKKRQANHSHPNGGSASSSKEPRIPRLGWQVEEAGQDPPPTCTWYPSIPTSSSGSNSNMGAMRDLVKSVTSSDSFSLQGHTTRSACSTPSRGGASKGSSKTAHSLLSLSTSNSVPRNLGSILKCECEGEEAEEDDKSNTPDKRIEDNDDFAAALNRRVQRGHFDPSSADEDDSSDEDDDKSDTMRTLRLPMPHHVQK